MLYLEITHPLLYNSLLQSVVFYYCVGLQFVVLRVDEYYGSSSLQVWERGTQKAEEECYIQILIAQKLLIKL